jgi:hypothetical protein
MKIRFFIAALAFTTALMASSYFPQFYHIYKPAVGEWSKYEMVDATGQKAVLTISVVSKEKDFFWIEVESAIQGETGLAAFLVSGDPTDDSNVVKVRLRNSDGPIIEIDKATLEKMKSAQQELSSSFGIGPTTGKIQSLPDEDLKIAGKSVSCVRVRLTSPEGRSADIWLSDDVAPFGVVKLISGQESLTLIDSGKGAKARLMGAATPLVLEGK